MTDAEYLQAAIDAGRRGLKEGELPFGACIVKQGRVVTAVHNVSRQRMDITAHAEMHAIQEACKALRTLDLSGCSLYASCEPCPMCFSACCWAKVDRVVFGSRIEDAARFGIGQIPISSATMKQLSRAPFEVVGDVLRPESTELFKEWARTGFHWFRS